MAVVSTPLIEDARSIFTALGYDVTEAGEELRAEYKWRTVYVTDADPETVSESVDLRCFVARDGRAERLRNRLLAAAPEYDWAVMRVDTAEEYEVLHPKESQALPTDWSTTSRSSGA
jgi:hypothetical protein